MTDLEKRILEMLRNVRNFGSTHEDIFLTGTLARQLFGNVENIVTELERLAAEQSTKRAEARQYMANKGTVRAALTKDVTIISRTAQAMALTTPDIADKFRLPENMTDQALLDTAGAYLVNSALLRAEFLRHELPESVFVRLEDNITAFQEALTLHYQANEAGVEAGAAFDAKMEQGQNHVRQLDAIVRNKLSNDPAALAAWERARHIERPTRRRNHDPANTPPSDTNNTPNT
jgi:hypothetical protein